MVGTMDSGNDSISWGNPVPQLDQGQSDRGATSDYAIAADDDNGTVFIASRTYNPGNSQWDNTRVIGFVTNSSNNTINSEVVDNVELTVHANDSKDYLPKTIVYDPDNNKYVALFEYGNNTFIKHISVDSSDGDVTQGTLQTLANDVKDAGLAYDPAGDYFVVGFRYRNSSHANYNQIAALPFTFDGSAFSVGTMYIPTTGITSTQGIAADPMFFNPDTKEFIYTYTYDNKPHIVRFRRKYYPYSSGIQFASRPILAISGNNGTMHFTSYDTSLNKIVIVGEEGESGTDQFARVGALGNPANNADGKFIGFSAASYSDAASAKIKITSSTTTQSSLATLATYYVKEDGSLSNTTGSHDGIDWPEAGYALSTTKLVVK